MKCSCFILAAALVLGSSVGVEAQSLFAQPEQAAALGGLAVSQPLVPGAAIRLEVDSDPSPSVALSGHGDLLAVWRENVNGLQTGRLLGRLHAPSGRPLSTVPEVVASAEGAVQGFQVLPYDIGYLVVWAVHRPDGPETIRARFLDASLQPTRPDVTLATVEGGTSPIALEVETYLFGGFLLVWSDQRQVFAQQHDEQGIPVGQVRVTENGNSPEAALLREGGFAVSWKQADGDSLWLRIFRADAQPAGAPILVSSPSPERRFRSFLAVSAEAPGHLAVAWSEAGFGGSEGNASWVFIQRFAADGSPLGAQITVDTLVSPFIDLDLGAISMRHDGRFLVLWDEMDTRTFPGSGQVLHGDVWARAYDVEGNPLGDRVQVPGNTAGPQFAGDARPTADGWLVDWVTLDEELNATLFARRFSLAAGAGCGPGPALCLNGGRFRVEATWRVPATGAGGQAQPVGLTGDTGALWFFDPANLELVVKVLDGTAVNGHFWVFFGSLTDVEFDLTVIDTVTGEQRTYHNPAGTMASRADTEAF